MSSARVPMVLQGEERAAGLHVCVVVSRFNEETTQGLLQGALEALRLAGAKDEHVRVLKVPGAWEIPFAVRRLLMHGKQNAASRVDAVVALGAVIRGETAHFDFVARGAIDGCAAAQAEFGVPVALGILTTEDDEQALARSKPGKDNKGAESALAAVEMASLARKITELTW
jgi:6,7-dimethyl-8-ribityllumazine synthase